MDEVKWVKANCPICGREYEYALDVYEPPTCNTKECVQKQLHPELSKKERYR